MASRAELRDGRSDVDIGRGDRPDSSQLLESSTDEPRDREQIFEILSNERRRLVLRYLREQPTDESIDFRSLVDQVAAWENDTVPNRVDSNDRKCVYTALRQTHLPKLDKLGVVEFDSQRGSIELSEDIDDVLLYMTYVPERERFWSRLYLLLAGLCAAVAILFWVGIGPFGSLSGIAVAIGIAATFGIASIAQLYQSRRAEGWETEQDWN